MSLCLQVCQNCGAQQYPRRDICHNCLSTQLHEDWVDPEGTVLSWTKGHFSVLPDFKDKTPLILTRVKLSGGAIVLALSTEETVIGAAVKVAVEDKVLVVR